uniref:Uncharacterized protein n=1 Tax=Octopus bimaculoides TaxID=37653 RepID=A0A0L8FYL6_OCTBM
MILDVVYLEHLSIERCSVLLKLFRNVRLYIRFPSSGSISNCLTIHLADTLKLYNSQTTSLYKSL